MTNNQDIHVVFGTGPVGMAVADELLAKGKPIRMVNRSGKATLPEGVELISGDATDAEFTRQASQGASVVYQCLNPPYSQWPELFPALQAGVLEGAISAGAKLVSMENVYMYGSPGGKPMTEDMPYSAHTKKGRVRAKMAEDLLAAHASGRIRAVIGRASDFYGPRVLLSAMGDRVFPQALEGKAVQVLGNPDMPHTYTYTPDVGKALVLLGERDEALGQAWHIPSAETVTTRQFLEMVFGETGHESKIQVAPKLILQVMGLFNADLREVIEMLYEFEEPFILDSSKFEAAFGNLATPLQEAIHQTVEWYRHTTIEENTTV
jgi:nucleoside-diphosphate-sugar epimerase